MATSEEVIAQGGARPKTHYWEPFLETEYGEGDGVDRDSQHSNSDNCYEPPQHYMRVWRPITDGIASLDSRVIYPESLDVFGQAVADQDYEYTLVLGNYRLHSQMARVLEHIGVDSPCGPHAINTLLVTGGYEFSSHRPHVRV